MENSKESSLRVSARFKGAQVLSILASVLLGGLLAQTSLGLPEDPQVTSGSAKIEQTDSQTLKITASDRSIIEFKSYNIAPYESVIYALPDSSATTLSRVAGGISSQILGSLAVNGVLVLVNPAGITFGPTARVEAGGLIASTLPLHDADFLAGQLRFGSPGSDLAAAPIVNEGLIQIARGGFAALVGGAVANRGTITAPLGTVALAAGQAVTVGVSADNRVAIAVDVPVAAKVLDAEGKPLTAQIVNTGTLSAQSGQVTLTAKAADGLFDLAVNQAGLIRADSVIAGKNGTIELVGNGPIRSTGSMSAHQGRVTVSTSADLEVSGNTVGETLFQAWRHLAVNANLTTEAGNLSFIADADRDGAGAFTQAAGTRIATTVFGDITIAGSGAGALADIRSAGSVTLQSAGAPAVYTQHPGSTVAAAGSFILGPGVTLEAGDSRYQVGRDWVNLGSFDPGRSLVSLIGPEPALVRGSTNFFDFGSTTPGKPITFEAGTEQVILGTLTFKGDFANLMVLRSSVPGTHFSILPTNETVLRSLDIQDILIRGPPIVSQLSKNSGNNIGLDFSLTGPLWTGAGFSPVWSDSLNWDGGFVPGAFDLVRFTSASSRNSLVDPAFGGMIGGLTLASGTTGTLTLGRDLAVEGDVTLAGGSLVAGSGTLTVAGNWVLAGGAFQPGTSTVVFTDASRPSSLYGNNTFYHLTSTAPGKELFFQAGATQTVLGALHIEGKDTDENDPTHVPKQFLIKLRSTQPAGLQWKLDPRGEVVMAYVILGDSWNLASQELKAYPSFNFGNNQNWNTDPTWDNGAGTANWSDANNWNPNGVPLSADTVTFNGTSTAASTVDAAFGGTVSAMNMNSGYTNTVTLARPLTVMGGLTVRAGTLDLASFAMTTGAVTLNGGTLTGTTGILTGASYTVQSGTISAILSGAVALTKSAGGTVTITSANTYTGATTVSGGVLNIQNSSALGAVAGGVTVRSGAVLQLQGGIAVGAEALTLNGTGISSGGALRNISGTNSWSGAVTLGSAGRINSDAGTLTVSGAVSGATRPLTVGGAGDTVLSGVIGTTTGTLTKDGAGTLILSGAGPNTYTGATTVSAGVLNIQKAAATGTTAGGVSVAAGATLQIQGGIAVGAEALTLNGTGISSDGALRNISGTNSWAGAITLASAGRINSDAGTLTLTGGITGSGPALTVGGAGNTALSTSGLNTSTSGTLTKDGTGTLTLTASGDYTGATSVSAGTLAVTVNNALGTSAAGTTVASGATLDFQNVTYSTAEPLTLNGGAVAASTGTSSFAGAITVGADSTVSVAGTQLTTNGAVSGSFGVTKTGGSGIWVLGNTLTLGGNLANSAGTLTSGANAIDVNGAFNNSGAAVFNAPSTTMNVAGNWTNAGTAAFNSNSGTVIFDGASGTQTLDSGGDSFSNLTHSAAGTLQLSGNALTVTGTLTQSSGTFDANALGTTVAGLATVSGGTYQASTATQTFNGGLTLSGGTFTAGSASLVDVNGTFTLSSGTFTAPGSSGTFTVSGNFTHSGGTFTHNAGTVTLDGGDQTLAGTTTFNHLTKTVASAATLTFPAGATQTIVGTLTLQGASGQLLALRSSSAGSQWNIDPQGSRNVSYVDVKDSKNSNAAAISPHTSVSSGNNTNWSFGYLKVTGTGTMTAGTTNELTVTAHDDYDVVNTPYSGLKNLTFSGLSAAPDGNIPTVEGVNFGSAVTVTFTSGVSAATGLTLIAYRAETASVDVTDGTLDSNGNVSFDLDLTVSALAGQSTVDSRGLGNLGAKPLSLLDLNALSGVFHFGSTLRTLSLTEGASTAADAVTLTPVLPPPLSDSSSFAGVSGEARVAPSVSDLFKDVSVPAEVLPLSERAGPSAGSQDSESFRGVTGGVELQKSPFLGSQGLASIPAASQGPEPFRGATGAAEFQPASSDEGITSIEYVLGSSNL